MSERCAVAIVGDLDGGGWIVDPVTLDRFA